MERVFFTLVFCICFVQNSLGLPSLTCDAVDPISLSTVKCYCQNVGAPGIDWYRGGNFVTPCSLSNGQCFSSMGYTFTVNTSTSTYTIEFGSYNYTQCTNVTCIDSTTPSDSAFKHISVDVSSYKPTLETVNEPALSHMDGNIDFATDCIYKANSSGINVTAIWTAVVNGTEEDKLDIDGTISKTGSCQFCTNDFASKISVNYIHQEEQSESGIKANIRLRLLIDGVPYTVTTRNEYFVKGKNESSNNTTTITNSTSTSDVIKNTTTNSDKNVRSSPTENPCYCWCWFDKLCWCIFIIIVVIVVVLTLLCYIPAAVIYFNQQLSNKLPKVLNYKNCRLFIPFFGLYLIIKYCKLDKGFAQEFSAVNVKKTSIKVRWKRYDRNPSSDKIYYLTISKNKPIPIADSGKTTFSYTFPNLQDSTVYDIALNCSDKADQNNVFKRYKSLKVRTKGVPEAPSEFRVDRNDITDSSIRVRWKPGDDGGRRQTFVLSCSTKDENIEIQHNGEKDMSYQWRNLSEGTYYDLELRAKSIEGLCTRIQPLKQKTLSKPGQPKNLRFEKNDITATSITVRWDSGSDEGCQQTFVVTIYGEGISPTCDEIQDSGSKASWLKRWTQLSKATDYDISIYAKNKVGRSETLTRSVKTIATKPDPPKFEEGDVTENSITVKWEPGHDGGCEQTFYVYLNGNEYKAEENGAYTFGQLPQKTYYDIALKAKNKEGEVSASPPSLHIRTHGRPDTPKDFEIVDRTNSTITMKWEPGNDGGFSQHFILMDVKSGEKLTDPIQDTADHIMQHTITNLKDRTEFKLQVQASNEKGTSSSKTEKVKTRKLRTADK